MPELRAAGEAVTDRRGPAWREWERRRDRIRKPRVSWCEFTRKWIVNAQGRPHECGRTSFRSDLAFRRWRDAMAEANALYREALARALGL